MSKKLSTFYWAFYFCITMSSSLFIFSLKTYFFDPLGRPTVTTSSDYYFHKWCLNVRRSPLFRILPYKTISSEYSDRYWSVGQAEEITDETLIVFLFVSFQSLCRGTRRFQIDVSKDKRRWDTILSGTLSDARYDGCRVELETFPVWAYENARFIKFVAKSYYGYGAGLQYITWTWWNKY